MPDHQTILMATPPILTQSQNDNNDGAPEFLDWDCYQNCVKFL